MTLATVYLSRVTELDPIHDDSKNLGSYILIIFNLVGVNKSMRCKA